MPKALEHQSRHHIFSFSAAKSYHQLQEMRAALYDDSGQMLSYGAFRKKVADIAGKYNELWLEAEYQAAKRAAIMGRQWQDIQEEKDIFPYLRYQTAGDERVRISHRELEGITLPVNDPFWQQYYPPNGWNCRCTVEQLQEPESLSNSRESINLAEASTPEYWRRNVGINNIFPESTTAYYDEMPDTVLEAVKHYGLRTAEKRLKRPQSSESGITELWSQPGKSIKVTFNKNQADILITDEEGKRLDSLLSSSPERIEEYRRGILIEK